MSLGLVLHGVRIDEERNQRQGMLSQYKAPSPTLEIMFTAVSTA